MGRLAEGLLHTQCATLFKSPRWLNATGDNERMSTLSWSFQGCIGIW